MPTIDTIGKTDEALLTSAAGSLPVSTGPTGYPLFDGNLYWDPSSRQQKLIGQATGLGGDRHNIQTSAGGDLVRVDNDGVQWHDMRNVSLTDGLVRRIQYPDTTAPYTFNEALGSFTNDPAASDAIPNDVWSAGHNINRSAGQLNPDHPTARISLESHYWFPAGSRFQSEGHWHASYDPRWGQELRPIETVVVQQPTLAKAAEIGFNASTWTMNAETGVNIASIRYDPTLMTTEQELYNSGASVWGVASGATADTASFGRSAKNSQLNLNGAISSFAFSALGVTYWQWLAQNVPGNTSMALRGQYGNLGYYFQASTPTNSQVRYAAKMAVGGDFSPLATVHAKPPIDFYPCAIFQRATSQSVDMIRWLSDDGTTLFGRVTKNGYWTWKKTTAIADADLTNSEVSIWFDPTPGATNVVFKGKDSAGTAVAKVGLDVGRVTTPGRAGPIVANTDAATVTFDLATSDQHELTMGVAGASRTLALSNVPTGSTQFTLYLTQNDGTQTVDWWTGVKWVNGTEPTLSTTAGAVDVITFRKLATGSYLGFHAGPNMS